MTPKLTILLVDDHKLFCEGLEKLLMMFECVGAVHTAMCVEEAHLLIHHFRFDVALLDLQLSKSGWEGFDLCAHMRQEQPDAVVAVVSMFDDDYMVQRAKQCGARAFFNKNMEPEVLGDFLLHASVLHKDFFIDGRVCKVAPSAVVNEMSKRLVFRGERMSYFFEEDDIICVKGWGSQSMIYTGGGVFDREVLVSKSIGAIEEMLEGKLFMRTHKSWIINMKFVKAQKRVDGAALVMSNGMEVPISRERVKVVEEALIGFISTDR